MSDDLVTRVRPAARACLQRAAGQHGRVELPARIENAYQDGQIQPCNAGTLVEIAWRVKQSGAIELQGFIDGVPFSGVLVL